MEMKAIDKVAYLLVVIGGILWGLIGWLDYDLLGELFGSNTAIPRIIYAVVGVAALYMFYTMIVMIKDMKTEKK